MGKEVVASKVVHAKSHGEVPDGVPGLKECKKDKHANEKDEKEPKRVRSVKSDPPHEGPPPEGLGTVISMAGDEQGKDDKGEPKLKEKKEKAQRAKKEGEERERVKKEPFQDKVRRAVKDA